MNLPMVDIPSEALPQLATIRDLPDAALERAHAAMLGVGRVVEPYLVEAALAEAIAEGDDHDDAPASVLFAQLVGLQGLVDPERIPDHGAVVQAITRGLERSTWTADEIERWRSKEQTLRQLLEIPCFQVIAKAMDLQHEHTSIYRACRVLTDFRPLFANPATADEPGGVLGGVVSCTLKIAYSSEGRRRELRVGVDVDDLQQIIRVCRRAMKKVDAMSEVMNMANIRVLAMTEEQHE